MDLKEEILSIEDQPKKDGVTGLESINGQVSVFLNIRFLNSLSSWVWRALYIVYGNWIICCFFWMPIGKDILNLNEILLNLTLTGI